ncbi:MAG: hypothetical protein Q8N91_00005 [Candidatus Omnitrophota bacterium]|nr:hypothetical protein [Candidatus Omnitrophota bacterium]
MRKPTFLNRLALPISVFIIVVSIILFKSYPGAFSRKKPGSFEYFRRGEELLDKGKYRDAIMYFARAYHMSPENKTIRSGLAYAYSKYGLVLAELKDFNKAIENFTKACEIDGDSSAIKNLAIMYSKKAVSRALKGDWSGAVEDFTNARMAAFDSDEATRTLGLSLFNDAVLEYKSGRVKAAALCLKESLLACEDSHAFELLGDIYYKERDLNRAVFYWNRARRLDPGGEELIEKLDRLAKEQALARTETSLKLPHFEIRYEKGLSVDARAVNEALEEAYLEVGRDLRYFPDSRISVFFYSQNSFAELFNLPGGVRAFYDGNIRIPLPGNPLEKDALNRYIYHEYAHAVVSAKTNNNCPVWLNEGIAVWQESKGREFSLSLVAGKARGVEALISSLDKAFAAEKGRVAGENFKDIAAYYLLAYSAVRFILDSWGPDSLNGILTRIASGQHAVNAIDDELLISEKEFNKRWREYLLEHYPSP